MTGLDRLDDMVQEVIESVITAKDFSARDFEAAAAELYPQHADLIVAVIKHKAPFMELWTHIPDVEEMYLYVIETLPPHYSPEDLRARAQQLFPDHWKQIIEQE